MTLGSLENYTQCRERDMKLGASIGLILLGSITFSMPVWSNNIQCHVQAVKNTCWQDRAVTLELHDIEDLKTKHTFEISKDTSGILQEFDCKNLKRFTFSAKFSPPIRPEDAKNKYVARKVWDVPTQLPPNTEKWVVKVCFSDDFSQVPVPMGAQNCRCEFKE